MTINDLPELSIEWLESLERSNLREKGRRMLYKRHYSSKMSYERFVYIQNLEQDGKGGIKPTGLYKLYSRNGFVIDTDKNDDTMPYPVFNGISYYVDENGNIDRDAETVVVYMKLAR